MRVQLHTKNLPILLTPRINGNVVTVTDIKTLYSNHFQNDTDTPMSFHLEYSDIDGVKQTIDYDNVQSTDSLIVFNPTTGLYDTKAKFAVLFYWSVIDANTQGEIERIYTEDPVTLEIIDQGDDI